MAIGKENVAASAMGSSPARGPCRRQMTERITVGKPRWQATVGRQDEPGIINIHYQADVIAEISVVELAEIGRGHPFQVDGAGKDLWIQQGRAERKNEFVSKIEGAGNQVGRPRILAGAAVIGGHLGGQLSVVIIGKQMVSQPCLLEVADTFNALRPGLPLRQRRQQKRRQQADNADHHQHLHQRETALAPLGIHGLHAAKSASTMPNESSRKTK